METSFWHKVRGCSVINDDGRSLTSLELDPGAVAVTLVQIIESYSCAVYSGGLPLHGRLYITAKYALFSGWRNTKVSQRATLSSSMINAARAHLQRAVGPILGHGSDRFS